MGSQLSHFEAVALADFVAQRSDELQERDTWDALLGFLGRELGFQVSRYAAAKALECRGVAWSPRRRKARRSNKAAIEALAVEVGQHGEQVKSICEVARKLVTHLERLSERLDRHEQTIDRLVEACPTFIPWPGDRAIHASGSPNGR